MKKVIVTITALALFATMHVDTAPDCMDTSSYLAEKIDYKELHLVDCNHNCYTDPAARIIDKQGKCTVCGHLHIPRPQVFVKTDNPAALPAFVVKKTPQNPLSRLFALRMP